MSAISPEILLDAITLLSNQKDQQTVDLINDLICAYTEDNKKQASMDNGINEKFIQLLDTIKRLPDTETGEREKATCIVKFLSDPNIKKDDLYEAIKSTLIDKSKIEEDYLSQIKAKLTNQVLSIKFNKCARQIWNKLSAFNMTTDIEMQDMYLNDVINVARDIVEQTQGKNRLHKGAVERIDMSDVDSIKKSLGIYKDREVKGILKTGLQGLNRMLGKRGGFALGESVCIFALLHMFKSGLLMTIARGLICHNDPPAHCKGKPVGLFISLENEANRNLMWFYKTAYETNFGKSSDGKTDEEIIAFVHEFYNQRGWNFFIERWPGNKFGYEEYINLIDSYEAQGYEVVFVVLDYANKMKKSTSKEASKREDLQITELFENICTYMKNRGKLFITAHQLNREAMKQVTGATATNHVKRYSAAFSAGSIGGSQEIDLEIFIHLETNHLGQKYLTAQRGKHRYVDDTPEAHKYFAYRFTPFGIGDDINTEPQFVSDIYAVEDSPATTTETADLNTLF